MLSALPAEPPQVAPLVLAAFLPPQSLLPGALELAPLVALPVSRLPPASLPLPVRSSC